MLLTDDQQSQVDVTNSIEATRHAYSIEMHERQAKLEAIRLAQLTLIENARSKPVDSREVTAADIATFANTLLSAMNDK
jgi:hypothetical protein